MIKRKRGADAPATYDNDFFSRAYAPWLAEHPEHEAGAQRLLSAIVAAGQARAKSQARHGCDIPETLVVSLTSACNLRCQFCGASDVIDGPKRRLPRELLERALQECRVLGVARIALIGGEPALFAGLEDFLEAHPDFFFSVYTNGVLFDDMRLERLARLCNHILIVNVSATSRRGAVDRIEPELLRALGRLSQRRLLFGYAATVHRNNRALFAREQTLRALHGFGPRLGVLFDYLPEYDNEADSLSLEPAERAELVRRARVLAAPEAMMFMCTPEDEEIMGGCGAAGRSFIHLGPDGSVSPCPFVPYSRDRFPEHSLLEVLRSGYFGELRVRSQAWEALEGPCAYRAAEHELRQISHRHGATRYAQRLPKWQPRRRLPLRPGGGR